MMDEHDDKLEALVAEVRKRYIAQRRIFFGQTKYKINDSRWGTCFVRLAELLTENKWGLDFIDAQFAMSPTVIPMPNQMYGSAAIRRYTCYTAGHTQTGETVRVLDDEGKPATADLERQRRFQGEVRYITTRLKLGRTVEDIISHKGSPICALTRYCVAVQNELNDIANIFRGAAKAQYALHDDYDDIYGDLIPESMRERK